MITQLAMSVVIVLLFLVCRSQYHTNKRQSKIIKESRNEFLDFQIFVFTNFKATDLSGKAEGDYDSDAVAYTWVEFETKVASILRGLDE